MYYLKFFLNNLLRGCVGLTFRLTMTYADVLLCLFLAHCNQCDKRIHFHTQFNCIHLNSLSTENLVKLDESGLSSFKIRLKSIFSHIYSWMHGPLVFWSNWIYANVNGENIWSNVKLSEISLKWVNFYVNWLMLMLNTVEWVLCT